MGLTSGSNVITSNSNNTMSSIIDTTNSMINSINTISSDSSYDIISTTNIIMSDSNIRVNIIFTTTGVTIAGVTCSVAAGVWHLQRSCRGYLQVGVTPPCGGVT